MHVLHVASELAPFAQTGGLADVVAGLPEAQVRLGLEATVLVPLYGGLADRVPGLGERIPLPLVVGPHALDAGLRLATLRGVRCAFLDIPSLFDRPGLYGPGGAAEFGDNHLRFAALGKAAVDAALLGPYDVLHAHDWHAGLALAYARLAGSPAGRVVTIHNLAFRGIFPKAVMDELALPWSLFTHQQLEFYDQVSFLKAGIALAQAVTTVSPTYAIEITTPERGEALDGFLRSDVHGITGIVNGIDADAWDPATDRALPAGFSAADLAGRAICREALAAEAGLPPLAPDEPLLGVVSRMSDQKGLDLVADVASDLDALGAKLVVLGSGEPALEARFRELARTTGDRVSVAIGFDIDYARRIYGGCDFFVMPSRFEPCGLGQLYAMRYGAIPIVHAVGGLRDTVIDLGADRERGTGLCFHRAGASELYAAIERGARLYRDRVAFASRQRVAMARDSSWVRSAREYVALYRALRA